MSRPRRHAALFDMHGTLLYEAPDVIAQGAALAGSLGVAPEAFRAVMFEELDRVMLGECSPEARAAHLLERLGLSADPAAVTAFLEEETALRRAAVRLYPGAEALLDGLRAASFRTALLTNCGPVWPSLLESAGLAQRLDVIHTSFEKGLRKPAPAFYLGVCEALGVTPQEAWYIGDGGDQELESAAALGFEVVHIDHLPRMPRRGEPSGFHHRATSLEALLHLILSS